MSIHHNTQSDRLTDKDAENEEQGIMEVGCQKDKIISVWNEENVSLPERTKIPNLKMYVDDSSVL